MDLETIDFNGIQIPIAISIAYNKYESRLFHINPELLKINPEKAVNNLFEEYFNFILKNNDYFNHIFVHNLGSFDGYFLYKNLLNSNIFQPSEISTIIDHHNKFIQIVVNKSNPKLKLI